MYICSFFGATDAQIDSSEVFVSAVPTLLIKPNAGELLVSRDLRLGIPNLHVLEGLTDLIPLAPLTKQNFCKEMVAICTRTQVLGVGVLTVPSGTPKNNSRQKKSWDPAVIPFKPLGFGIFEGMDPNSCRDQDMIEGLKA